MGFGTCALSLSLCLFVYLFVCLNPAGLRPVGRCTRQIQSPTRRRAFAHRGVAHLSVAILNSERPQFIVKRFRPPDDAEALAKALTLTKALSVPKPVLACSSKGSSRLCCEAKIGL